MAAMTAFIFNDGGRSAAGFKGSARDCVTRAVAIAAELPYGEVYKALNAGSASERRAGRNSARTGISVKSRWFKDYMRRLDFVWVPTMSVGGGCKVHLRAKELPRGRLVVRVSGHCVAVIDGDIHDTHDCSRDGTRCVYGYWKLSEADS